jgi:uncharacterized surface protein with fasciclin (FAS1) repeats
MKKILYTGILAFLAVLSFSSCDKNDDPAPVYPSLDSYIGSATNLTIFKAALEKAQLQAFKDGPGPFTWIAPTDAAFNAKGVTLATIGSLTVGEVNYVLQYHLINALVTTPDMVAQNSFPRITQQSTAASANVYIGQLDNNFYVNGSKLISTDNRVSNGVVHVSSRLNIPPNNMGNLQSVLVGSGQHTLFIAALMRAGSTRWSALGTTSVFTVFAPNDVAMTAAGYTTASIAATPVATIDSVVRYHMFSGTRLFTNDIGNKKTPGTFLNATKTLTGSSDGTKIKGLTNASPADILISDVLGTNGVIHSISGVLKY